MKRPSGPWFWAAGWGGWRWQHRSRGGHEFGATAVFSASGYGRSVSADTRGSTGLSLRAQSISPWISASGRSWWKACPLCMLNLWETKTIRNESTVAVNTETLTWSSHREWEAAKYSALNRSYISQPSPQGSGMSKEGREGCRSQRGWKTWRKQCFLDAAGPWHLELIAL